MKGCKIVQDLLPNYIEGLTNEETNGFIEKHLKECENCGKILNSMRKDIEIDTKMQYQKETKYLKKYNKKVTILKSILIIVIIVYTMFIGRKMVILGNIQNNIEKYIEISNYHIKSYYYKNDAISVYDAYVKENISKESEYYIASLEKVEINSFHKTKYSDGEKDNYYIETQGHKIATINREHSSNIINIKNDTKFSDLKELLLLAFTSNITNEICNGIECYKIDFSIMLDKEGNVTKYKTIQYIDKQTGLVIRYIDGNDNKQNEFGGIRDYQYEFNVVEDNDFVEPNIEEYEIENFMQN